MRANTRRDRFLSHVRMASPVDQPALVTTRQLFLTLPYQLHGAIPRHHLLPAARRCTHFAIVLPTEPPPFSARLPPSIGISAPVIQQELSEARKTARPLMSSGRPR